MNIFKVQIRVHDTQNTLYFIARTMGDILPEINKRLRKGEVIQSIEFLNNPTDQVTVL